MLAGRCDELLAVDVSERAVVAARERLSGYKHVVVERRTLPEQMPDGPFDLIVASEILYYYTREEMLAALRTFERELARGGVLLAVHWRRETRTYPLQGDEVHELLLGHTRLHNSKTNVEPDYRLDLFEDPA
jgi:predicted TPR repeat methyltransferase